MKLPMKIGPGSPFSDGRYKPHRYTIFYRERLSGSVPGRGGQNFSNLLLCQFGGGSSLTNSTFAVSSRLPMTLATSNPLRVPARPMIVTGDHQQIFDGPRPSSHTSVPDGVRHVLLWGCPIEIVRTIVGFVIVAMSAVKGWIRPRAIERGANKIMHGSQHSFPIYPDAITSIPPQIAWRKHVAEIFSLPVRPASAHSTTVGNLIIGSLGNNAPFLVIKRVASIFNRAYRAVSHSEVTFRRGQGRARLQPRFRPVFLANSYHIRNMRGL